VSAAGFLIEWSPALNKGVLNIESVWPGADVVDIVGASFYNDCTNACIEVPQLRWKSHLNARWGLEWHAAFARKHNKPRSFAEWGTGFRTNGQGGRDDSYFIEKMAQTVADESVIYHNYFDYNAPDFNAKLSSGQFPNAAREFRILFGETY
jgi:hypothetical protein